jgi:hypothetical protein
MLPRMVRILVLCMSTAACSGDGYGGPNNNGNNNGTAKVLTATINGTAFAATSVTAAFLNGNLAIAGVSGGRSIQLNAVNVSGPGTISLNLGNQWSALGQHIDGSVGQFSTGYGGTGSLTLTTATLSRVTGTFTFTAYTSAGGGLGKPVITVLNGLFDITSP